MYSLVESLYNDCRQTQLNVYKCFVHLPLVNSISEIRLMAQPVWRIHFRLINELNIDTFFGEPCSVEIIPVQVSSF